MWQEMALFESNVFRRAGGVLGSQRNGLHRQYALAHVEPMTGIEPALSAWEAEVLPLNYSPVRLDAEVPAQPIKPGVGARARGGSLRELLHRVRVGDRVGRRADEAQRHAEERLETRCGRRGVGA